jgi:CubicO group peptidase (beta-lactamase class C family)
LAPVPQPRTGTATAKKYDRGQSKVLRANYASEKIWKPFGMERDAVWMLDAADHELGGCCISMTVGDYARFGQFILEGGKAGGPGSARAIVPDGWVAEATGQRIIGGALPQGIGYGYFWWVGSSGGFSALGIFGQSSHRLPRRPAGDRGELGLAARHGPRSLRRT